MEEYKTLYEWCFINKIRPLDIKLDVETTKGDDFMLKGISLSEFKKYLKNGNYKKNSLPRKPEKFLELRMYGLVPYNISKIQQGIQFGHAVVRFSQTYKGPVKSQYDNWADNWETFIILNGGTSNEGTKVTQGYREFEYFGSMQNHLADLEANDIVLGTFYEPDLNSMLSAICFIVDERVFNKDLYPDFEPPLLEKDSKLEDLNNWSKLRDEQYQNWLEKIGGPKNEFLRTFLADKRLA